MINFTKISNMKTVNPKILKSWKSLILKGKDKKLISRLLN